MAQLKVPIPIPELHRPPAVRSIQHKAKLPMAMIIASESVLKNQRGECQSQRRFKARCGGNMVWLRAWLRVRVNHLAELCRRGRL